MKLVEELRQELKEVRKQMHQQQELINRLRKGESAEWQQVSAKKKSNLRHFPKDKVVTKGAPAGTGGRMTEEEIQASFQSMGWGTVPKVRSFADALMKPPRAKTTMVTKPMMAHGGIPLQPDAEGIANISKCFKFSSVQPARTYLERDRKMMDVKHISTTKTPDQWPVGGNPTTFHNVLIVGRPLAEAMATIDEAMRLHPEIDAMGTVINAERAGPGVRTVDRLLETMMIQRDDIQIADYATTVQICPQRCAWQMQDEEDDGRIPQGALVVIRWTRPSNDMEQEVPQDKGLDAREHTHHKIVCTLYTHWLMPEEGGKIRSQQWAKAECWKHVSNILPGMAGPPPMTVGWRGDKVEIHLRIPLEAAALLVASSGRAPGVEFRPFVSELLHPRLRAKVCWVKLPSTLTPHAVGRAWGLLKGEQWFAGLLLGDKLARLGVRHWHSDQPMEGLPQHVAAMLGVQYTAPRTKVKVRGYGPGFGMAPTADPPAQNEVDRTFGHQAQVRVESVQHLTWSGVDRPIYILTLQDVPPDWQGERIVEVDAMAPTKVWERMEVKSKAQPYRPMGPNTRVNVDKVKEARQQQEAARAPSNQEPEKDKQSAAVANADMNEDAESPPLEDDDIL